jgi:hypothetical protein
MAQKKYAIIEYREFSNQNPNNGYYTVNRCVWDSDIHPDWWSRAEGVSSMLVEYGTTTSIGPSGIEITFPWSYIRYKDGVATTVTLPDIDVKIPSKDVWILPLITS